MIEQLERELADMTTAAKSMKMNDLVKLLEARQYQDADVLAGEAAERIEQLERELADMTTAATGLSDDLTRLGEQLAESQAREAQMRQVLEKITPLTQTTDLFWWQLDAMEALSIPTDDTALRQAIAKELRAMSTAIAQYKCYDAQLDIERRANELENRK